MKNLFIVPLIALSLMACSSSKEEAAAEDKPHRELYNAVNQPLEKAKDVERQILDNAAEQKKQADDL